MFGLGCRACLVSALLLFAGSAAAATATVALQNSAAPGTPAGVNFGSVLSAPVINDTGQVAFSGLVTGPGISSSNDSGAWLGEPGALQLVLREGANAPGTTGNTDFSNPGSMAINHLGQVAFESALAGPTVTSSTNEGLWTGSPGNLQLAARKGSAAPSSGIGVNYSNFLQFDLSDSGMIVFRSTLTGAGVSGTNDDGIWRGVPGDVDLIAREGNPAPGAGVGVNLSTLFAPSMNNVGQVAFNAALVGAGVTGFNDEAVFRGLAGGVQLAARKGNAAAGTSGDTFYEDFLPPLINDAGQVAFRAFLQGMDVSLSNNEGIWRGLPGDLQLVARAGNQAAGVPAGVNYDSTTLYSLNAGGQVLFLAGLVGAGVDDSNDSGLWRGAPGNVQLIARAGNPISAALPGVTLRTVGQNPALNDSGQALFGATLGGDGVTTANDQGLFLSDGEETIQVVRKGESLSGSTVAAIAALPDDVGSTGRRPLNAFSQVAYHVTLADGRDGVFRFTPEVRWRRNVNGQWNTASNWTLSIAPGAPHDVTIDPAGSLTVSGPTASATVNSLIVGGGTGIATLDLQQGGAINAVGGIAIEATGVLTGDGTVTGGVANSGTVLADNVTIQDGLANFGLVTGDGRINATLSNFSGGEVRVAEGEHLRLTGPGPHSNAGRIEVLGGELEVDSAQGFLAGRDARLRFGGGLANQGPVGLSFGTTDVFGPIQNLPTGKVILSGGGNATFYDDVVNNGELRVGAGSTAVYFGEVSGAGSFSGQGKSFFEGTFSPGNSPASVVVAGDVALGPLSTLLVEIGGAVSGTQYDQLRVGGSLELGGTLAVRLLDGFEPDAGQSFSVLSFKEHTGWFDAIDLPVLDNGLSWRTTLTDQSFELTVVPEPSGWALATLGLLVLCVGAGTRKYRATFPALLALARLWRPLRCGDTRCCGRRRCATRS